MASKDWYLMSRPLYNSGFEDDEFGAYARDGFEEVLDSAIALDVEIYDKSIAEQPLLTRAIIQNVTGDIYNNSPQRQILCRIGTLRCGQYVRINGRFWIVATLPDNNRMYEKAIMLQCRHNIRFVSPVTGDVVEYPVYSVNSTQYGSGETHRTYITIGSSQHLLYIPYNTETIRMDCGARFLIDKNKDSPTAFKLTQVDTSSFSCGEEDGMLQWTLVESQIDEQTDNIDLMVADYYRKSELSIPEPPEKGYSIAFDVGDYGLDIPFGGQIKVGISFFEDGIECSPFPLDIVITDGVEYASITEVGEDYFIVHALDNREYIGQEVTVAVCHGGRDILDYIVLQIKGWY